MFDDLHTYRPDSADTSIVFDKAVGRFRYAAGARVDGKSVGGRFAPMPDRPERAAVALGYVIESGAKGKVVKLEGKTIYSGRFSRRHFENLARARYAQLRAA